MPRDAVDVLLEQWAHAKPDLNVSAMGVIGRVFRANYLLTRGVSEVFESRGFGLGEFDVMATLLRAGEPHTLAIRELQGFTMVTGGAMTNRLDQLSKKGWITREPMPGNRRTILVRLTETGKEVVEEALLAHVANEERLLAALSPEQRAVLADTLSVLLADLGDNPPPRT